MQTEDSHFNISFIS